MNFKRSALFFAVTAILSGNVFAQEKEQLATTKVQSEDSKEMTSTAVTLDAKTLAEQSITNIEDTARYEAGVQINDSGNRFGDDGFNIRGLEGDAVAVTVDGISQGETLNPSSFAAYGMFGSSRGQVELEHVKTVTISKGPSAVANGSGALAGAVTYVTNDASDFLPVSGDATGGRVKTGFDSRSNEWLINGSVANRTGNFESLLQYTRRDGNETEAHSNGAGIAGPARGQADPMDNTSDAVLLKLAYNLSEDAQIGVVYEKTDRSSDGTPLSREPAEGETASYYNFSSNDENNRERAGIFYKQDNAGNLFFDSIEVKVDYQQLYTSGLTSFLYSSRGAVVLRQEDRSFEQDSTSLNIDLKKSVEGDINHDFAYGVNYQSVSVENIMYDRRYNGETTSDPVLDGYPILDQGFVPASDKHVLSVYAADTMALNEAVKLYVGARYDKTDYEPELNDSFSDPLGQSVSDAQFNALIGEVGLSYEFVPGQEIQAKISQGYKAPTLQELYFGTNSGEEITDTVTGTVYQDIDEISNPDLDAEKSVNYEISYLAQFERGFISLSAFRTNYTNRIQSETFSTPYDAEVNIETCSYYTGTCTSEVLTEDVYTQAQNSGEIKVEGIEFSAFYLFTDNITGRLTYSALDGEYLSEYTPASEGDFDFYDKGDDLETLAPDSATVSLGYLSDERNWGIKAHMVYSAGMDESDQKSFTSLNNGSGPFFYPQSYTVFDLTGFYAITENLTLTAAIYNLTDKEFYNWGVVDNLRSGNGGFFSGVSGTGYQRFSEPGRSASAYITYTF
ncbi:MAG: TonB-dependent hemoglobin/transferrin/lactoferrin family receptor [Pseudomonadota bacterium]|nr:TonB-dependent hemoglobin/transferrin/lactoferrin family receptor [Pseudomonadota bacterium]